MQGGCHAPRFCGTVSAFLTKRLRSKQTSSTQNPSSFFCLPPTTVAIHKRGHSERRWGAWGCHRAAIPRTSAAASFSQAVRTDPGRMPTGPEWRDKDHPPAGLTEWKKNMGSGEDGAEHRRWCRKEEAYKPDRAHFCRVMGRGVLRMDHHCPWLANTIGFQNHKFFYLFLLYTNAACSFLGLSALDLLVHATLPALNTFLLIGAESLTMLLSSILVPFFGFHTWLLCRNMTTIEFCSKMGAMSSGTVSGSPYDVGLYQNLCSVLGDNPLLWWVPAGGPSGDGLRFARRDIPRPLGKPGQGDEDADPEATHPKATGDEEVASIPEMELVPCGEGFLVWRSAAEFTDDLRVGCEFLGETIEDTAARILSLCTSKRIKLKVQPSLPKKRTVRIVSVRSDAETSSNSDLCGSDGTASGAEFL